MTCIISVDKNIGKDYYDYKSRGHQTKITEKGKLKSVKNRKSCPKKKKKRITSGRTHSILVSVLNFRTSNVRRSLPHTNKNRPKISSSFW